MTTKNGNQRLFEFQAFINSRKIRKMSTSTIEWYEGYLGKFFKYLDSISFDGSIEDITTPIINGYLGKVGETCAAGTVHICYRTVKTFLNWYDLEVEPDWRNPITRVRPPKLVINPLPGITRIEFESLLAACGSDWYGKRDRAIVRTLIDTGVRRSEFLSLTVGDVEVNSGIISVYKTKNHKRRSVFLGVDGKRDIMRYIRELPNRQLSASLWTTKEGKRLSINGLREIMRRLSNRAGIAEPGFHDFRRAFALQSHKNGMSDIDLMKVMGHSTTEVLKLYLATDDEDLRIAQEKSRSDW